MSAVFELEINRGAGLEETFVWRDDHGNPIDLTGMGAEFAIYPDIGDATLVKVDTTTVGDSKVILGTIFGTIKIVLQPALLVSLPLGNTLRFHIDAYKAVASPTLNKTRIIKGNCVVIGTHA